jgi:putative MFS transporter
MLTDTWQVHRFIPNSVDCFVSKRKLFPTRIRSRAVRFVYSWSRLAAAFAGLVIGALLATGGVPAVAVFIGGAMAVGIVVIGLFGPSTNGRALELLNN